MAKKPANLIYGVNDKPPLGIAIMLSLQHVFALSSGWIYIVVIVSAMGGSNEESKSLIQMSMIASGVATILQASVMGPVGSGYLCPINPTATYIGASILAGKAGGVGLIYGMTLIAGLFQVLLSRLLQRLRALFPPEVVGLVVAMVGIELVGKATTRFLGFAGSRLDGKAALLAVVTLAAMIGPSVWSKGKLRLYPLVLGLATGYVGAFALGLLTWEKLAEALDVPWMSVPGRAAIGWSFSFAMLVPFLVASLASVLKIVGDLTLCQKINDADWKRTDMKTVSGGVLAGSIGTVAGGLLGGVGQSTNSGSVGLSIATKATSRSVAWPCGLMLIVLAFFPKLAAVFATMPLPVMGAFLVYVACFIILGGIQVITSRMLDARKIFVVGIPLIFGLSVQMVPGLYAGVPTVLDSMFASSLSLGTILVVALNVTMRIGISSRQRLELKPGPDHTEILFGFMEQQGGAWGARREVVHSAMSAMNEFMEAAPELRLEDETVRMEVSFDEFNLDVQIEYRGALMEFPDERPTKAELKSDDRATIKLSGYMIRNYCDGLKTSRDGRTSRILLHFDH